MKKNLLKLLAFSMLLLSGGIVQAQRTEVSLSGNAYQTAGQTQQGRRGGGRGFSGMIAPGITASTYFRVNAPGEMSVSVKAKADKACKATVAFGGKTYTVKVKAGDFSEIYVGKTTVSAPGYQRVDISGKNLKADANLQVSDIVVEGSAVSGAPMNYVHDFEPLWGRRGPSTHLNYIMPQEPSEWFYNEVTVPEGNDVTSSYFMSNGFGEGYFGMQVNSATERRVLFSVWSPYTTDNPNEIPEEDQIVMLKKGETVHAGEFGGEGSGGQSYMIFPWKAGLTYKFLTRIKPDGQGRTVYTSYFYDPEQDRWMLIASFRRPKIETHYTRAHSFLENFSPAQGYLTREVYFDNQWVCGVDGQWRELTEATFTCDNTGREGMRVDYQGGSKDGHFYLKGFGFFDETTPYRSKFSRPAKGIAPQVDLEAIEKIGQ